MTETNDLIFGEAKTSTNFGGAEALLGKIEDLLTSLDHGQFQNP